MALLTVRKFEETVLELPRTEGNLERWNHVFEPEFHQDLYVNACKNAAAVKDAFQLGDTKVVQKYPYRGIQPIYADDDNDPETLEYEGMIDETGSILDSDAGKRNVCALKSTTIKRGFIDYGVARSVSRSFYSDKSVRSSVRKDDLLINSTGDGTLGRVAVFDQDFPAVVDGHITIVRFKDRDTSWYTAAYLLSLEGQKQIYRYVNGSSGQVEIYPQDIARLWIPPKAPDAMKAVGEKLRNACAKHNQFYSDMKSALNML